MPANGAFASERNTTCCHLLTGQSELLVSVVRRWKDGDMDITPPVQKKEAAPRGGATNHAEGLAAWGGDSCPAPKRPDEGVDREQPAGAEQAEGDPEDHWQRIGDVLERLGHLGGLPGALASDPTDRLLRCEANLGVQSDQLFTGIEVGLLGEPMLQIAERRRGSAAMASDRGDGHAGLFKIGDEARPVLAHARTLRKSVTEVNGCPLRKPHTVRTMSEIAERIRKVIAERELDERSVAREAGLPYTTWRDIVSGVTKNPRKLREIARALTVSMEWLASGEGDMTPLGQSAGPAIGLPETGNTGAASGASLVASTVAGEQTVAALMERLGPRLQRAPAHTRYLVGQALLRYSEHPEEGATIARTIETLLQDVP